MTGIITTHDSKLPPTIIDDIRGPRMYPTPNSAADISTANSPFLKKGILK